MKRFIRLLLVLILLLPCMGQKAEAATSGSCGANVTWNLNTSTGVLTISGTGDMQDYYWYDSHETVVANTPWYSQKSSIKSVSIEQGITSIGSYAFYGCSKVTRVTIPEGITRIGEGAFDLCTSLTVVALPESVEILEKSAFDFCEKLESISLGKKITSIGERAFCGCDSLRSIVLPDTLVTIGPEAFYSCDKLAVVVLGDQLETIGNNAFTRCTMLRTITLPENVKAIGYASFSNCDSLDSMVIPASVTALGDSVFYDCDSLRHVEILGDIAAIGTQAFYDCNALTSVQFPDGLKTIGNYAFYNCGMLSDVIFPDSLIDIGQYAFNYCMNLNSLKLGYGIETVGEHAFRDCLSLKTVAFGNALADIGDYAFFGCNSLEKVFYTGNSEQKARIRIGLDNTPLDRAVWYFNGIHQHEYIEVITWPTCTEVGYTTFICPCGDSYVGNETQTVGHRLTDWMIYSPASCLNTGEERRECGLCDYYETRELPVTDHVYTAVVTEPTCTTGGYTTYTCVCGDTYIGDETPASHDYTAVVTAPTCTEGGYTTYTCHCGDTCIGDEVAATGHNYTAVVTAPTCTEAGYTTYTCECGDSYVSNRTEATGHSFGSWSQTKAPTASTKGEERRDCANCDHYETRAVAALSLTAPKIKASAVTATGKTKLSWDAAANADFYRIYRAVGSTGKYSYLKSTRSTSFTDTGAEAGTNYYYKIKAVVEETGDTSGFSNIVNRCCDLAKPVVTLKVDTASGKPKVTFEKISGAEKYYIVRSTSKTGTYSKLATITGTSYIDKTAKVGTNYYYKVKALHAKDAADSAYSDITNRVCDLAKPVVSQSVNTTSGKPVVKWETVEGAAKYRVYRSTQKDSGYELVYTAVTARTYTDKTAKAGTNYYYKVKAVHTNSSADSAYSAVVNRVCDLAKPVVSITRSNGDPKITWETVEGAEKYEIWRATSKTGTYKKVKTAITARSYTDTSATAGKTYYYKVMAIHSKSAANSAYSSVKYITAK